MRLFLFFVFLYVAAVLLGAEAHADSLQFCSPTVASAQSVQTPTGYNTVITASTVFKAGACSAPTPPPVPGSFYSIPNSAGGYFTHWSGTYHLDFCNGGCTSPGFIDVSKFDQIFQPWPGQDGLIVYAQLPVNQYFSAQFTVPAGRIPARGSNGLPAYGAYSSGETNNQAGYSITISTSGGDFSNPSQSGSTVVPGCWKSGLFTHGALQWNAVPTATNPCQLQNGKTYYLNYVNATIGGVLPGGKGSMTSTKRWTCTAGTYCVLPIYNGSRNFP